jgi:uncharacterized damage-inducible protein DinB
VNKFRRGCVLLALLGLVVSAAALADKASPVRDMPEFVHDWQVSKQFTLDVANAMPAEFYSFKPNPDVVTFGELMNHIAGSNVYRFHQISGIQPPFPLDPEQNPTSDKQSVLRFLEQSFDYVINVLPKVTPEQLKHTWHVPDWKGRNDPDTRAMMLDMFVHTAHHRAQGEVYMRVKGIRPPDYMF